MKYAATFAGLASVAAAFPSMDNAAGVEYANKILQRASDPSDPLAGLKNDPLGISKAQTNCGPLPCPTFNLEDQRVELTGEHAYVAPGPGDIRGPCPGLNAAANHGYLPRNGIASIEQTASGLGALYNMAPTLAVALAAYAIALDGNVVEGVWSIGGPLPKDDLTSALLGTGQGLSYSHNNYEGDSSIGRNDAALNHGDAHSLNVTKFTDVYNLGGPEDRYTLDKFRKQFEGVQDESIRNNPYYFTGAFSTFVVVPAAYNFVINFMSNHSEAEPSGYLDGYNFKSFFGITGEPGSFVWQRGQERVPDNWYRRPSYNPYTAADVFADVGITYAAYPNTLKFGGNTGTPNSFVGVDIADFSKGLFDAANITSGNNLGCFAFAAAEQGIPAALKKPLNELSSITGFLAQQLKPVLGDLGCASGYADFDQGLFNSFPGRTYSPTGPATNY